MRKKILAKVQVSADDFDVFRKLYEVGKDPEEGRGDDQEDGSGASELRFTGS